MITTDFPVAMACGSIAAVVQTRYIRATKPNPLSGRVVKIGAAMATVYGAVASTMIIYYPDWMNGYAADSAKTSPWLSFLFFVPLMTLTGYGSGMMTQIMIEQRKSALAIAFAVFSLVMCAFNILVVFDAFTHVGTFAQWCAGTAPAMSDPSLAEFRSRYNMGGLVFGGTAIALLVYLIREARKLGPQP